MSESPHQSPRRVLVLAPHPDDESIGCGGTLRQHVVAGDVVHCIVLTSGEKGGHGRDPVTTRRLREAEAVAATRILGLQPPEFWHARDGALRASAALVQRLAAWLHAVHPEVIYVPHEHEMHPDHRAAVRLLRGALRRGRRRGRPPEVRGYEVWTPIRDLALVIDVSEFMEVKRAAIRCYETQNAVMDFEAAIAGLNRYRGEMHSWPGGDYAEVFARFRP